MANALVSKPDLVGAMNAGLGMRLAYDKFNRPKAMRVVGGGRSNALSGRIYSSEKGNDYAPFSPQEREVNRQAATNEEMQKELLTQTQQQTQSNELASQANRMALTEKGLQNAASYAGQINQGNYRDWYNWVMESDFLPSNMFTSPDIVEKYSPEQFEKYRSKISSLKAPNPKLLDYAIKLYDIESANKRSTEATAAKSEESAKDRALKEKANVIAQERNDIMSGKQTAATNIAKSNLELKQDEQLLKISDSIFQIDKDGYQSFATDKNGSAAYVNSFNKLAEQLGRDERIVWTDEPIYTTEKNTIFPDKKSGGYVIMNKNEAEQIAPTGTGKIAETTAIPKPGDQLSADQIQAFKDAANQAIANGKNREAVMQRLKEYGIDSL